MAELNQQAGAPGITLDTTLPKETAIVTRKPIKEMAPTLKPSTMKNNSLVGSIKNAVSAALGNNENTTNSPYNEYVTQSQQTVKTLAAAVGMPFNDFANINGIQPTAIVKAKTVVKVPSTLAFKSPFLVLKK